MTLQLPEEKANYELVASAYGYESKALRFSSHSVSNLSRTVFLKAEDSSSSQETPTPSNEVAHEPATGTATANVMLEELEEPQAPLPQKDVKKQEKDSPRLQLKVTQRTSLREKTAPNQPFSKGLVKRLSSNCWRKRMCIGGKLLSRDKQDG